MCKIDLALRRHRRAKYQKPCYPRPCSHNGMKRRWGQHVTGAVSGHVWCRNCHFHIQALVRLPGVNNISTIYTFSNENRITPSGRWSRRCSEGLCPRDDPIEEEPWKATLLFGIIGDTAKLLGRSSGTIENRQCIGNAPQIITGGVWWFCFKLLFQMG